MSLLDKLDKFEEKKPKVEKPEVGIIIIGKKPKKTALTNRTMNKTQTLDEIYSLGKEFKDKITISKLRSVLEDFKLYSKR